MTYLQLCQRLRQEARIPGSGPSTVVGQTGEMARLVSWIADAWYDIQSKESNWRFMRASCSFTTVNAQATYTPAQAGITATAFGQWIPSTFRVYRTATGTNAEMPLYPLSYDVWRDTYQFGAMRTAYSQPLYIAVTPSNALGLGPVPTGDYTIVGDYYTAPVTLAADSDTPALPATHSQMIIVYKALMNYGASEEAPAVYSYAMSKYNELLSKLVEDQLPVPTFGAGAWV